MKMFHCCIDVRGVLRWPNSILSKLFLQPDGSPMSAFEATLFLTNALAEGKEVLPTCECDNFDFQKGCQGHEVEQ